MIVSLKHYDNETIQLNGRPYSFEDFRRIEPSYTAPWGFSVRVYEKGVQHYASDGCNTIRLPLHDSYCDQLCNREGELLRLLERLKSEQEQ
jgi:hypothetical protein